MDPRAVARVNRLRPRTVALLDTFSAMPRAVVLAIGLAAILAVAVIDYLTGLVLSLAFFYLIPIVFTAWLLGRAAGNAAAVATLASVGSAAVVEHPGLAVVDSTWWQ